MIHVRPVVRRAVPFLIAGVAAFALVAWAPAVQAPQGRGGERAEQGEGENELETAMDSMGGALKTLLKGINAENQARSLELVARLQSGVLKAKLLTPPMAAKIEESKRAEFVAGFRRKLVEVLATTCRLETALLDGKFDEANALAANDLTALKRAGHDAYQEEEEEGSKGRGK